MKYYWVQGYDNDSDSFVKLGTALLASQVNALIRNRAGYEYYDVYYSDTPYEYNTKDMVARIEKDEVIGNPAFTRLFVPFEKVTY